MNEEKAYRAIAHIQSISGIKLSHEQLDRLLREAQGLHDAIKQWNGEKGEAGHIARTLAQAILGESWPTDVDGASQGEFINRLQSAATQRGYDIVPIAD
ncbi:hypothetical protein [Chitiniphilus eburneus]|uniref:Uncharacterized protein n=1 Tax=Chitiniphilus eburneus TaxID=2571148 RepID=A0A4U0Q012_9NEIS|nr:hypothetical protein [Chitiniphilus eburneus]TJZ74293.1 hypothetical protein FAZ21_08390 [Chitiniphilus eburneus]